MPGKDIESKQSLEIHFLMVNIRDLFTFLIYAYVGGANLQAVVQGLLRNLLLILGLFQFSLWAEYYKC